MVEFLSGMIAAGCLIAALFFCRFWRRTKDSLFAIFSVSFVLFALSQLMSVVYDAPREDKTWVYLLRLAGFVLLMVAIARKNRASGRERK
ncbi:MAG: DUF5985 family protein [Pseudolabrys sp.]